jgi:hypothetical protein
MSCLHKTKYEFYFKRPPRSYFCAYAENGLIESCLSFGCLGDVVVSVLATEPKGRGFISGQGDGFLRAIKIRSTPSSRIGSKAGRSHVVRFYGM